MNVLCIIFSGMDYILIKRFRLKGIQQCSFGIVYSTDLYMNEDSSTAIMAQLLTGKTWKETSVMGEFYYNKPLIDKIEKLIMRRLLGELKFRKIREAIYDSIFKAKKRKYIKSDLKSKTLFEIIPNSKAIYVPAYNPEPSWCLDRLIFDIREYPKLGEEAAVDLIEKDLYWRSKKIFKELQRPNPYKLLMCHLQTIDSAQHLYIGQTKPPNLKKVYKYYKRMNLLARKIIKIAEKKYDIILFLSEHGIPMEPPPKGRTYHVNRGFFSLNIPFDKFFVNIREFYYYIQKWALK